LCANCLVLWSLKKIVQSGVDRGAGGFESSPLSEAGKGKGLISGSDKMDCSMIG
jgi:hypothetical protein